MNEIRVDMELANRKLEVLKDIFREMGPVAIGFSGGVDSTFMARAAADALGRDQVLAVTASSAAFPERERREAMEWCREQGIRQIVVETDEVNSEAFRKNPKNRCYLCKKEIFGRVIALAEEYGIHNVCEGSNMDDLGDYRPGLQAIAELQVKSPLRQAELYKAEIRALSREMGLPTWSKPSFACLASRFVYGEEITREKLTMVEQAEKLLMELGFPQFRVRMHGMMARIEVLPEDMGRMMEYRERIAAELSALGFAYVTMDLQGYRTGSMNEGFVGRK